MDEYVSEVVLAKLEERSFAESAELRQARANTYVAEIRRRWYLPE
ncbi:hypothetical protein ACWEU6_37400 [Streptosporangium sandarakinum]